MRYQLERFAFWIVRLLARIVPRKLWLACGKLVGRLAYLVDFRHRPVAVENFMVAFPDATGGQATRTVRRCYEFFGYYLFDMLTYLQGLRADCLNDFEFEGLEYLDAAYAGQKGVIVFTAHWGAWELMALAHGYKGYALSVIARKLDNPYLEQLLRRLRTCTGNLVIDKNEGFRPTLRALRDGKGIAILIDQNVTTEDRVFVNFFERPASTTPALALLKMKTDAVLIPAFALPLPRQKYLFQYGAPVEVTLSGNRDEDVRTITQK